jgi:LacI family transcriptional regulator
MAKPNDKTKKPTIRDVANRTGLSVATVSRALHNPESPFVSATARERVKLAAEKLGYVPNLGARALIRGATGMIGFWMADSASPYYWLVGRELTRLTRLQKIHLAICSLSYIPDRQAETVALLSSNVDGIIAMDVVDYFDPLIQPMIQSRVPLVTMGVSISSETDSILLDLATGAVSALEHLFDTGRRRIALMVNESAIKCGDVRHAAYERFTVGRNLPPIYIYISNQRRSEARSRIKEFMTSGGNIDAVLCINDETAIGCYRGLCDLGVQIPDEVSVVGFDGIEDTEYHYHPISTVAAPVTEMCEQALQLVQERIKDPLLPLRHITITPTLMVRESSFKSLKSRQGNHDLSGGGPR